MGNVTQSSPIPRSEGKYVVCDEIAAGGTATVHFGRLLGQGFARTVAIKRLHPTYARDPVFVDMFLDEARLSARIRHPNVCAILDVATLDDVPCLVLEYVHGEPLSRHIDAAVAKGELVPYEVSAAIVWGMLQGLHAAHEATDEAGQPLRIIHRDVSPQNVLVGTDGVPRVVDFGMAKATGRLQNTAEGQLKGKMGNMAPEQFELAELDRRVDVYSAAVVLWETLTGQFLFERTAPSALMHAILEGKVRNPCSVVREIPDELGEVCMRGLCRDPAGRFATAQEMAVAIESAILLPSPREVGAWVSSVAGGVLEDRARVLSRIEAEHPSVRATPSAPPMASSRVHRYRFAAVAAMGFAIAGLLGALYLHSLERERAAAVEALGSNEPAESAPPPAPIESVGESPASLPDPVESSFPVTTPPRGKRRPGCSPPYTIDRDGIRRPKRECLKLSP